MPDQLFATRLKKAMDTKGLKQVALLALAKSNGLKLGKSQLSQYVGGKTIPRESMLCALAGMLGTTPEWLLGANGPALQTQPQAHAQPQGKPQPTPQPSSQPQTKIEPSKGTTMRTFKKSSKLDNVLYDVRGPVLDEANRMTDQGIHVLKLNIGNPAPFGFRTPDEVVKKHGFQVVSDDGALEKAVDEALAANPDIVEKLKSGNMKPMGAIIGAVMRATRGQADAKAVTKIVMGKIK